MTTTVPPEEENRLVPIDAHASRNIILNIEIYFKSNEIH